MRVRYPRPCACPAGSAWWPRCSSSSWSRRARGMDSTATSCTSSSRARIRRSAIRTSRRWCRFFAGRCTRSRRGHSWCCALPSALVAAATTILAALIAREVGGGGGAQADRGSVHRLVGIRACCRPLRHDDDLRPVEHDRLGLADDPRGRSQQRPVRSWRPVSSSASASRPSRRSGSSRPWSVATLLRSVRDGRLRSWWAAGGIVAAIVLAAPYVIWQQQHGWPQMTVAHNIAGSAEGGRIGFIPFQLVMVSPFLVAVWIAGLLAPFRRTAMQDAAVRPARPTPCWRGSTSPATARPTISRACTRSSSVSVRSQRPTWTLRTRSRQRALTAALVLSAAFSGLYRPAVTARAALQGSIVDGRQPRPGRDGRLAAFRPDGRPPGSAIPAPERLHTAIFTANYGEAGSSRRARAHARTAARLQRPQRLQRVGPTRRLRHPRPRHRLRRPRGRSPLLRSAAVRLATVNDGVGLDNDEQGLPILLCDPTAPWPKLWPLLTHFD